MKEGRGVKVELRSDAMRCNLAKFAKCGAMRCDAKCDVVKNFEVRSEVRSAVLRRRVCCDPTSAVVRCAAELALNVGRGVESE